MILLMSKYKEVYDTLNGTYFISDIPSKNKTCVFSVNDVRTGCNLG